MLRKDRNLYTYDICTAIILVLIYFQLLKIEHPLIFDYPAGTDAMMAFYWDKDRTEKAQILDASGAQLSELQMIYSVTGTNKVYKRKPC